MRLPSELPGAKSSASNVTGLASTGWLGAYDGWPVEDWNSSTVAEYPVPSLPMYWISSDFQQVPSSWQVSESIVVVSSSNDAPMKW